MMMKILLVLLLVAVLAIASLPFIRNAEEGPLNDNARAQAPGQFAELSLGQVHYELQGEADKGTIVLVHGFSVPSYTWHRNVLPLVDAGYRVLIFDLYGRGWSDRPDVTYNMDLFVNQVLELLDSLDISEPVHIAGLSMGGAITAAFTSTHPDRVRSMMALAPKNGAMDIGPLTIPVLGEYLAYSFFVPGLPESQLGDFVDPAEGEHWAAQYTEQMGYDGFRRALLSTAREVIAQDALPYFAGAGNLGIPSLLLWGDSDQTIPLEQSSQVMERLGPNAQFVIIEQAGHAPHYEKAEDVNKAILSFLESK